MVITMSKNFKDRVRQEFEERYPDEDDIFGPTTDQYFSLAGVAWSVVGMFVFALLISSSPLLFGVCMIMFFCALPFTLIWGVSKTYDATRYMMKDAMDDYLENEVADSSDVKKH